MAIVEDAVTDERQTLCDALNSLDDPTDCGYTFAEPDDREADGDEFGDVEAETDGVVAAPTGDAGQSNAGEAAAHTDGVAPTPTGYADEWSRRENREQDEALEHLRQVAQRKATAFQELAAAVRAADRKVGEGRLINWTGEELGWSREHCRRYKQAGILLEQLCKAIPGVALPACERHARKLCEVAVKKDARIARDERAAIWTAIRTTAAKEGRAVAQADVNAEVDGWLRRQKKKRRTPQRPPSVRAVLAATKAELEKVKAELGAIKARANGDESATVTSAEQPQATAEVPVGLQQGLAAKDVELGKLRRQLAAKEAELEALRADSPAPEPPSPKQAAALADLAKERGQRIELPSYPEDMTLRELFDAVLGGPTLRRHLEHERYGGKALDDVLRTAISVAKDIVTEVARDAWK